MRFSRSRRGGMRLAAGGGVLHAVADLGPCPGGPASPACLGVQREAGTTVTVTG